VEKQRAMAEGRRQIHSSSARMAKSGQMACAWNFATCARAKQTRLHFIATATATTTTPNGSARICPSYAQGLCTGELAAM